MAPGGLAVREGEGADGRLAFAPAGGERADLRLDRVAQLQHALGIAQDDRSLLLLEQLDQAPVVGDLSADGLRNGLPSRGS